MSETADNADAETTQCDRDRELYETERKAVITSYLEAEKGYDTWVLTLSGGALGLSMTFLKDIAKPPVRWSWMLFVAWILLALSVVFILVNLRLSSAAYQKFVAILDKNFSRTSYRADGKIWERIRLDQRGVGETRWIDWLNRGSLLCFLVGIVLLALFLMHNLK